MARKTVLLWLSTMTNRFQFCPQCGGPIQYTVPPDDDRKRDTCPRCDRVFYHNPIAVVGCIPTWEDRILLCRRAIEPRIGFWTLPAGFLELGESTPEAGVRETREEALANVTPGDLFTMIDITDIGQIHMFYTAQMHNAEHAPGIESSETWLAREDEVPWRDLAFPTIYRTLELYFADQRANAFSLHNEAIDKHAWARMRFNAKPSDKV